MSPISRRRTIARACACGIVLCAAIDARAIEDVTTPRGIALGNSMRSSATGALGPMLNPAGMTLNHEYDVELSYGYRFQDLGSSLYVGVVDSVTSKVSAALYYEYVHSSPRFVLAPDTRNDQALRSGSEVGLSLGLPVGERFSLGLTAKYVTVGTDTANPSWTAASPTSVPQRLLLDSTTSSASADGFTVDAGLILRLGDAVNVGVVGYNLVPLHSIEAPTSLGMGLSYSSGGDLVIAFDAVVDFGKYLDAKNNSLDTWVLGGGLEYIAGGKVPLRVGCYHDTGMPGTFLGFGLGYTTTGFGFDLGYRQKIQGGNDSTLMAGLHLSLQ